MKSRLMLLVVVLGLAVTLSAQTFRGGIQGVVTDSSGAAVASADVTVTNEGTGLTRTVQTSDAGEYAFTELPIGSYSVSASRSGFQTQTVTGATVSVSAVRRVDITLAAGSVEQKVEVTATLPLIQTTGNTMGGTIQAQEFSELPVNGRDYIKLIGLVSGVAADPSAVTDSPGSFGLFSINGNRGRSNNYLLDGTDMNDGYRNLPSINEAGVFGTPATLLPVDAIAEMAVLNTTEAEYGRNSGAIVNIVTKSGTNDFHGVAFYFGRADALDARNYFNQEPAPQSTFRNDQFGGSIGGPFIKDKTFWFFAYEGQRERVGIPTPSVIPTQDQVNCFQTLVGPIHRVSQNILDLGPWTQGAPLEQSGDGGAATADCVTNPATPLTATLDAAGSNDLHSLIFKMDHNFNSNKDLITGRYFFGNSDQSFPLGLVGGSAVPGYNTVTPTTVHVVSLSWTHNFSERLLMEVRGGYNRFFETFFPEDSDLDPASLGLNTVTNPQDFGLPLIRFSGAVSNIGANLSVPRGRVDTNSQVFANVSYNTGKHNWKLGYEFRRTFVNAFFDAGYRGRLTFDDFDSFLNGVTSGGGNRQARGNSDRDTFQNNHSFYVQDNFRWTRKLTMNLGLRWDYNGVIGEEKGRFSLLDPTAGLVFVDQLYPKDYNNFGPRISFAYDLGGDGKTVIRGGWGIYYDAFSQDFFVGQLPFNTFNPGPAYNPIGPDAVLFGFGDQVTGQGNLTLTMAPCTAPDISVPGTMQCAPPVFAAADFFDSDVFTVDQELATPYIQNYNLNLQQELGSHAAFQVGYVGSAGRRLFRYRDINQSLPNAGGARPFDSGPFAPSGGTFFYVNQFESTAASAYNALQTQLTIRNWHGFNSKVNYSWSHSIDNASDGQDYVANATQPDNSFNPSGERARSNFDTRHRFTWYFTYDLPKTDTAKWLLSGWSIDGVFSYSTGQPFHLVFFDDYNGTGEFFPRPDLVGDPFAGTSQPFNYLNLSAFQVPCTLQNQDVSDPPDGIIDPSDGSAAFCAPGSQHFGNHGRNSLVGPSFHNFDFSLSKAIEVSDRVRVNFRADFFNIFNHPNFTNPLLPDFAADGSFNGVDPVTGRGSGFLPLRATPDVGIGNPFLGGGGSRNIQLGVRVTF
ncbi:MAG: TonB-dependent receptor domain-containing protein [Terriglobales bacterium]